MKKNILISDSETWRVRILMEVFSQLEGVNLYRFHDGEITELNVDESTPTLLPDTYFIRFRHGRDRGEQIPAVLKICIGGYGFHDPDKKDNELCLNRAITKDAPLTKDEAQALIEYAKALANNDLAVTEPTILLHPLVDHELEKQLLVSRRAFYGEDNPQKGGVFIFQGPQKPGTRKPLGKTLVICDESSKSHFEAFLMLLTFPTTVEKPFCGTKLYSDYAFSQGPRLLDGFDEVIPAALNGIESIVLQSELGWDGKPLTSFYGLEILRKLRQKGCKLPILICSFLGKKELYAKTGLMSSALKSAGHYLVRIPEKVIDMKAETKIQRLTDKLLEDIVDSCFDLKGRVQEIFHNFNNQSKIKDGEQKAIDQCFANLILAFGSSYITTLKSIRGRLVDEWTEKKGQLSTMLGKYREEVMSLLPDHKSRLTGDVNAAEWSALLVDDDAHTRESIQTSLTLAGIHCITAKNGEKALELMRWDSEGMLPKEDGGGVFPCNRITVLICDWRFQNENGDWDFLQGYDIIEQVRNQRTNFCSFFLLTSKRDKLIKEMAGNQVAKIYPYYKGEVLEFMDSRDAFIEKVRMLGNEMFDRVISQPQLGYWLKSWNNVITTPMKFHYLFHLQDSDYHKNEEEISSMALAFIKEARQMDEDDEKAIMIKSGIRPKVQAHLTIGVEADAEMFRSKLIGRRIFLGLHLQPRIGKNLGGWDTADIVKAIKYGTTSAEEPKQINVLVTSHLCLPIDIGNAIPNHLLKEELIWLRKHFAYGLPCGRFFKLINEFIISVVDMIEKAKVVGYEEEEMEFFFLETEDLIIDSVEIIKLLSTAFELVERKPSLKSEFEKKFRKLQRMEVVRDALDNCDIPVELANLLRR